MKSGGLVAALALALALLGGLVWWLARDDSASPSRPSGARVEQTGSSRTPPPTVDAPRSEPASTPLEAPREREARGSASYAPKQGPTGSLLVRAVWGSSGKPAVDVEVRVHRFGGPLLLHDDRTRTDLNGAALFESLTAGLIELRGDRSGHIPSTEIVAGARAEVEFVLDPGLTVSGRVSGADGRSVSSARVWARRFHEWVLLAEADNSGRYRIDGAPAGLRLVATSREHAPSRVLKVEGAAGAVATLDFEVREEATSVIGQVVDSDERAVSKAVVLLQYGNVGLWGDGTRWTAACDEEGRFEFHSVPPGDCKLIVQSAHFAPAVLEKEVVLGARHELIVRVEPGAELTGVVRMDGKPAAGALVLVLMPDGGLLDSWGGARTDAQGRYRLAGLPPGPQTAIAVRPANSETWTENIEETDSARAETEIELVAGRAVIWNPELKPKD